MKLRASFILLSASASSIVTMQKVDKPRIKALLPKIKIVRESETIKWPFYSKDPAEQKTWLKTLFAAAQMNNHALLCQALCKVPVNSTDDQGKTVLHYATRHAKPKTVAFLIKSGANVDAQDASGNTPMLLVMPDLYEDNVALNIQVLVTHGANPHLCNNEAQSPVSIAIQMTIEDYRQFLLDAQQIIKTELPRSDGYVIKMDMSTQNDDYQVILTPGLEVPSEVKSKIRQKLKTKFGFEFYF